MCSGNQSLVNYVKHLSVQHVSIDGSSKTGINVLIDANHTKGENVLHLLLNYLLNYKLVVSINQLVAKKSLLNNHILDIIFLFILIGRLV
jgi:chorismate mutase